MGVLGGSELVLVPLVGSALILFLGKRREELVPALSVSFAAVGAGCSIFTVSKAIHGPAVATFGPLSFVSDGLSAFVAATASVLGAIVIMYAIPYMRHEQDKARFYSLLLFVIGSMNGLVLSGNFLLFFIFWRATGIASLRLVAFEDGNPRAKAGARKASAITRVGDAALFAAIMILWFCGKSGMPDMADIASRVLSGVCPRTASAVAAFLLLLGAGARSAQVPFHAWLPDAMESPSPASALLDSAATLNGGVYLITRMYPAFRGVPGWTTAVAWMGASTLLYSAFGALTSKDLKKMLAYSTMSQIGFMFLAVGSGNALASEFHLVSHAVFKALLFMSAGAVVHEAGTRNIADLGGAGRKMPVTRVLYLLGVMGLSGIPMFSGFFSKDMILESVFEGGHYVWLAVALAGTVLTFTYSWSSYFLVFSGEAGPSLKDAKEAHPAMLWAMGLLGVGTLSSWILIGSQSAGLSLLEVYDAHRLTASRLVAETFGGTAVYLSLAAIVIGSFLTMDRRKRLARTAGSSGRSR